MAVGEALTNLAAAAVGDLKRVKLRRTGWPRPVTRRGRGLFDTVRAVAPSCVPARISIPSARIPCRCAPAWQMGEGRAR